MGVNDGLFAGSALEEFQVLWIVHEEVLCEDCGAEGFSEDVEAKMFFLKGTNMHNVNNPATNNFFYCFFLG